MYVKSLTRRKRGMSNEYLQQIHKVFKELIRVQSRLGNKAGQRFPCVVFEDYGRRLK